MGRARSSFEEIIMGFGTSFNFNLRRIIMGCYIAFALGMFFGAIAMVIALALVGSNDDDRP